MRLKLAFLLVFVLMFGALGFWEGAKTLDMMFSNGSSRAMQATPIFWLSVFVFAIIASLITLFAIRRDLK